MWVECVYTHNHLEKKNNNNKKVVDDATCLENAC